MGVFKEIPKEDGTITTFYRISDDKATVESSSNSTALTSIPGLPLTTTSGRNVLTFFRTDLFNTDSAIFPVFMISSFLRK